MLGHYINEVTYLQNLRLQLVNAGNVPPHIVEKIDKRIADLNALIEAAKAQKKHIDIDDMNID